MSWLPYALLSLALTVFVVLAYRRHWHWTGFSEARRARAEDEDLQPAKTLWDWLQLLVVPLALAGLAFLLNDLQSDREKRIEDQRERRQEATAADAAREEALRAYLTQMSELMLDRDLLRSAPGADVRAVARTVTLTVLRRVDGERRGLVVRFLAEARLLRSGDPKVELDGANLRSAALSRADLTEADLTNVDLTAANLRSVDLTRADLIEADLTEADLRQAFDLFRADFLGADLRGADLRGLDFTRADLTDADLTGADLRGADLSSADLTDPAADITGAMYDSRTGWPAGFDPAAAGARQSR
jgi:uncharacterized protein YjbI with pentapeptide repeats